MSPSRTRAELFCRRRLLKLARCEFFSLPTRLFLYAQIGSLRESTKVEQRFCDLKHLFELRFGLLHAVGLHEQQAVGVTNALDTLHTNARNDYLPTALNPVTSLGKPQYNAAANPLRRCPRPQTA